MKCNANNLIQRSHAVNSENNLSKSGHHILYMHTYHTWTKIFHLSLYSLPTLGVALVDLARMTNFTSIEAFTEYSVQGQKLKEVKHKRQVVSNLKGVT